MIYDLRVAIRYDYDAPSLNARNLLRVMPMNRPGVQRRITGALSIEPGPDARSERQDFFGNAVTEVIFQRAVAALEFTTVARVERRPPPERLDLSPELDRLRAEISEGRDLTASSPHHFLGATPRAGHSAEIAAFARDTAPAGGTALETVATIGRALHAEMRFEAGATDVDTPPEEAFRARRGVCQDFTHVMIVALRALGLPAGYASGLIRTEPPPGQPRLEGADAMHAWVRAWCGRETGWVDYDPTNDLMVGTDHVSVAHGRDYADVAPVKGALRSSGASHSNHAVDLVPVI
ncbi:MAG: transglutaminase family protein [Pseudomonadota bacterium]